MAKNENEEIDVGAERERRRVSGERGVPSLATDRQGAPPGVKAFLYAMIAVAVVVGGFMLYRGFNRHPATADNKPADVQGGARPALSLANIFTPTATQPAAAAAAPAAAQASAAPADQTDNSGQPKETPAQILLKRELGGGLTGNDASDGAGAAGAQVASTATQYAADGTDSLESRLRPVKTAMAQAGPPDAHPDFTISQGTMFDCVLTTRIDTTVPGMVSCSTTRDVWSEDDRVILIPRDSLVTGFYDTGLSQGEARIFVTWSRIKTPGDFVPIEIDSPGTDPLGGSGVPGQVNNHFWQRFGGTILLSVIQDSLSTASSALQSGGSTSINVGSTTNGASDAASIALQNSINIKPTLYASQGARVSIYLARDLDMSNIYTLSPSGSSTPVSLAAGP